MLERGPRGPISWGKRVKSRFFTRVSRKVRCLRHRPQRGQMQDYRLNHIQQLEAESIHIIREVAAEFERPVMLYSIGKDSSVMLRLAQKAFAPAKLPFPLLHVDTTWKFKDMIRFRDETAKRLGLELIVHSNTAALEAGA